MPTLGEGHTYISHNYVGHNYIGHNYLLAPVLVGADLGEGVDDVAGDDVGEQHRPHDEERQEEQDAQLP